MLSSVLGVILGVCYDALRSVRHALSKKWTTALLDVLFGFLFLFTMFCFAMSGGESRVRGYMFVGAALGAGEYFLVLSPIVRRGFTLLAALGKSLVGFALSPVKLWITFLKKFSKIAKFLFKFLTKWYRMKVVFIRRPKRRAINGETDR